MTSRLFKYLVLPACALAALGFAGISQAKAAGDKPLTRADVEQMMHDYIVNNPQLIMDSVDQYQRKSVQAREQEGMKKYKDLIQKDNTTPDAGNPKGDITVVEFFDYNCHFCKGAFPALQTLMEKDKNIHVVFRDFPILGPTSETAAKWALAAQKQKKYYEFHKAMMETKSPISDSMLENVAKEVGMDVNKAKSDLNDSSVTLQIEKNRNLASELGLSGTPAFIVGDEVVRGAVPLEDLEKIVADQRKK